MYIFVQIQIKTEQAKEPLPDLIKNAEKVVEKDS